MRISMNPRTQAKICTRGGDATHLTPKCWGAHSHRFRAGNRLAAYTKTRYSTIALSSNAGNGSEPEVSGSQNGSSLPELPPLDDSYESFCTFTAYANWLIPERLMVGRYPYVEPSRCVSRDQGDEQIEEIMRTGVGTFVSLQAEIPQQEKMRLAGVEGFLPYRGIVQSLAAALSDPPSLEELSSLRTPELDRFLPAGRHPALYENRRRITPNFLHFPIEDLSLPSDERVLESLLADLEKRMLDGEKIYLHCWGGRGRAGIVGALLLAQMYGIDADEALARVQRAFDTRRDGQRRSPETNQQHEYVKKWISSRQKESLDLE